MPRNEGWNARPWERVRTDGRGRLDTYMNARFGEKLTPVLRLARERWSGGGCHFRYPMALLDVIGVFGE